MTTKIIDKEEYRDKVPTIDDEGNRIWIYPKKPEGLYTRAREIVAVFLLILLFGIPFLKLNDQPFILFLRIFIYSFSQHCR